MFYITCVNDAFVSYKSSNNVNKTVLAFDELWYYESLSSGHISLPVFRLRSDMLPYLYNQTFTYLSYRMG